MKTYNDNVLPVIGQPIDDFECMVFCQEKMYSVKVSDFKNKWLVLFFYPADFTFVCPTELEELADNYEQFKTLNTEIICLSTDTVFVHKAWHDHSPAIKKIMFPMGADTNGNIARGLGVYIPAEGLALRGTFIIDPDGILQAYEVNSNNVGRNALELLRKLQAAQFVREHHGEVCPANWHPGEKTLTPGLELVGKL